MHAAHHYSHYNYAAAQQYSHLMATAGGFPMNPAMYHAAAGAAQPDRSNAGTPHPAAVAAAAANPVAAAGQQNSHAHAAAAVAGHHMYPPGYPNYLNYR